MHSAIFPYILYIFARIFVEFNTSVPKSIFISFAQLVTSTQMCIMRARVVYRCIVNITTACRRTY